LAFRCTFWLRLQARVVLSQGYVVLPHFDLGATKVIGRILHTMLSNRSMNIRDEFIKFTSSSKHDTDKASTITTMKFFLSAILAFVAFHGAIADDESSLRFLRKKSKPQSSVSLIPGTHEKSIISLYLA